MKATQLREIGTSLEVRDIPEPELLPGSVIVRILRTAVPRAASTCFAGKAHVPPPVPYTPGPSGYGVVDRVADDVHGIAPGQIVWLESSYTVASNDPRVPPAGLLIGWFPMTPGAEKITAAYKNGSWAEKQRIPAECVHPVPEELAARLMPNGLLTVGGLSIAYGALLRGRLTPGQSVLVNGGTGALGGGAALLALSLGATTVYVAGRNAEKLERLREVDPQRVVPVSTAPGAPALSSSVPGGVDLFIDFVGYAEDAKQTEACIACLRPGGTAVLAGGVRGPLTLDYATTLIMQHTVVGSFMYPRHVPLTVMRLLAAGPLSPLMSRLARESKEFSLDEVNQAVAHAAATEDLTVLVVGNR